MKKLVLAAVLALSGGLASAAPIPTVVSTASTGFNGSLQVLNDGIFPAEMSVWSSDKTLSWKGTDKAFTFSFGDLYRVDAAARGVFSHGWRAAGRRRAGRACSRCSPGRSA